MHFLIYERDLIMKKMLLSLPIVISFVGCTAATTQPSASPKTQLYFNGDIITMVGEQPQYAQAILVENGKILFVGSLDDAKKITSNSQKIDLHGKTLLPGFIDAHGHAFNSGIQAIGANLLAPPDGKVTDIPSLIRTLDQWEEDKKI